MRLREEGASFCLSLALHKTQEKKRFLRLATNEHEETRIFVIIS